MSEEQQSLGWKKWVLVLLLMGIGWGVYQFPARDPGLAFRRAVYRGQIDKVAQLLTAHPELVNLTNTAPPVLAAQRNNQPMNFMDKLTVELFASMTGAVFTGDRDEFQRIEDNAMTPLQIAVVKGDDAMAELLLQHGANVAAGDRVGMTALHMAAMRKASLVRMLLAHQAQPNSSNRYSQTPLVYSIGQKDPEILELLLKAGADPNLPAANGWYPLHSAASARSANSLALLLKYGARTDVTNSRGFTPLDVARDRRSTNAIRLLAPPNP